MMPHSGFPHPTHLTDLTQATVHWPCMPSTAGVAPAVIRELRELLGGRASDAHAVRDHHRRGESYHAAACPDVVCFPATTDEVAAIVKLSGRHQTPVLPWGAGHASRNASC